MDATLVKKAAKSSEVRKEKGGAGGRWRRDLKVQKTFLVSAVLLFFFLVVLCFYICDAVRKWRQKGQSALANGALDLLHFLSPLLSVVHFARIWSVSHKLWADIQAGHRERGQGLFRQVESVVHNESIAVSVSRVERSCGGGMVAEIPQDDERSAIFGEVGEQHFKPVFQTGPVLWTVTGAEIMAAWYSSDRVLLWGAWRKTSRCHWWAVLPPPDGRVWEKVKCGECSWGGRVWWNDQVSVSASNLPADYIVKSRIKECGKLEAKWTP